MSVLKKKKVEIIKKTFPDGKIYEGEAICGVPHGKGIGQHPHGSRYEGEFRKGVFHGKGVLYVDTGDRLEGDWKNGTLEGEGIHYYVNGDKYVGGYSSRMKDGKGKFSFANGDIIEGVFKGHNVTGVKYYVNGDRFEGSMKNGKRTGKGVHVYTNGDRYEGEWIDGKEVGSGVYFSFSSGNNGKGISIPEGQPDEPLVFSSSSTHKDVNSMTKSSVLEHVRKNGLYLKECDEKWRKDREVVMEAVKQNGHSLRYGQEFKNDKNIVWEAVRFGGVLEFAGHEIRNAQNIVLKAVKSDGEALRFASDSLKNDRNLVSEAVKQNPFAIEHASDELKRDCMLLCAVSKRFMGLSGNNLEMSLKYFGLAEKCASNDSEKKELFKIQAETFKLIEPERAVRALAMIENLPKKEGGETKGELERSQYLYHECDGNWPQWEKCGKMFSRPGTTSSSNFEIEKEDCKRMKNKLKNYLFDSLNIIRLLGHGKYGMTFLCSPKDLGDLGLFVVKVFHMDCDEDIMNKHAWNDYLQVPYNPNVVMVLSMSENIESIVVSEINGYPWDLDENILEPTFRSRLVFMRYYRKDVEKFMEQRIKLKTPFSSLEICYILKGVLEGSAHLNKNMIVHRDLHLGNLFVDEFAGRVWIGDFGCALDLRKNKKGFLVHRKDYTMHSFSYYPTGSKFTTEDFKKGGCDFFLPPEVRNFDYRGKEEFIDYEKTDLYSIGVIGCQLMCFSPNYIELEKFIRNNVKNEDKGKQTGTVQSMNPKLISIVRRLIEDDKENRLSYENALNELNNLIIGK